MKALFPALLIAGVIPTLPSLAQSPTAAASASSPLLGSWAVDLSRLQMPPEQRPKGVTITYSDAGGGKWRGNVEVLGPDGSKSGSTGIYTLDGTPAPLTGDMWADTAAAKTPEPNVMILMLARGSEPASTRIYTVSPDGKTMTETAAYFSRDGKPMLRTSYFNRLK